jgi:FkbM family methyltransferase
MSLVQAQRRLKALLEGGALPLPPLPPARSEMVIYGAGNCGREALSLLQNQGYHIAGFLDARGAALGKVGAIGCATLESEQARRWAAAGLPVVLAVFNYAADVGAIANQLQQIGFQRVISYYELFERFSKLSPRFWLAPRRLYRDHAKELADCLTLWSDETSRLIFLQSLELRLTFNLQLLRQPDQNRQYFPGDLPPLKQPIRFVDGGAFVGDTLQNLVQNGFTFSAVAAFEPDLENFRRLRDFVGAHRQTLGDIILFPCGLGSETGQFRFKAGMGEGSLLHESGNSSIQVVRMDDVLPTFVPTFIKLDVEGAEPAALLGAQETISRCGPDVAVCLYHAAQHLWEVPFLLHQFRPDYSFALRYHQFNGLEVVAYAFRR